MRFLWAALACCAAAHVSTVPPRQLRPVRGARGVTDAHIIAPARPPVCAPRRGWALLGPLLARPALGQGFEALGQAVGGRRDLEQIVDEAMATGPVETPIIPQFLPGRAWLWRRWSGTIVSRVLPREVLLNMVLAAGLCCAVRLAGPAPASLASLAKVDKVWLLSSGLVSFTLSFFLTNAYAFWRSIYSLTRRVQGRLNDLGLLCAAAAERGPDGEYTAEAEAQLRLLGRYVRLFNVQLYASLTARYAPLRTARGLDALVGRGALTAEERDGLLASSMGHNAVLEWIATLINSAVADGRFGGTTAAAGGGPPLALALPLQASMHEKLTALRATYAAIEDELSGRMPLAYTQLVQIMVDLLVLGTPCALIHSVGGVGAVVGTGLVTLFHSSTLNLAKSKRRGVSNRRPLNHPRPPAALQHPEADGSRPRVASLPRPAQQRRLLRRGGDPSGDAHTGDEQRLRPLAPRRRMGAERDAAQAAPRPRAARRRAGRHGAGLLLLSRCWAPRGRDPLPHLCTLDSAGAAAGERRRGVPGARGARCMMHGSCS